MPHISLRQWIILSLQSLTLGALMALALAGAFEDWLAFWISLLPLAAIVFYAIKPWPGDQR